MATVYAVDVNVNLLNQAGGSSAGNGPMGSASALRDLDRGIQDVQRSSEKMMGTWGKLFAFREMEKFGRAGAEAFNGIIQNAGNLEESMLNVRLGLNLTAGETDRLKDKFYELDQAHKTSANEMARTALILQQSGIRDQAAMLGLMEPGGGKQGLLTFQDVMKSRAEPIAPEEAARLAMQFIDTAAVVGPTAQANMLDLVVRALQFDPQASPGGLLGAFQNIHRTGDFAGLPLESQMQLAAMTTMGGQSGREATQIGHLVGQMQMIGHTPGKAAAHKAEAMREMGILGPDGNPTGDIFSIINQISELRQRDPEGSKRMMATAFPDVRRQEEILELTEPGKLNQIHAVQEAWGKLASLGRQHEILMGGINSQLTVFKSNLQDISSAAGTGLLDSSKDFIGVLNSLAGDIKRWQQTPEGKVVGAAGATVLRGGSAALEVAGQAGIVAMTLKMLGLGGAALTGAGAAVAGVAGLAAGAWIGHQGGTGGLTDDSIGAWVGQLPGLKQAIEALTNAVLGKTGDFSADTLPKYGPISGGTALSPLPSDYVLSKHPHHALHHAIKHAAKNYSSGVRAAPGLFMNPTTGAGPR